MRRLAPLPVLLLAACSTTPRPVPAPVSRPATAQPQPIRTGLSGLSQNELQQKFGPPSFTLREGPGLKLQWQNGGCVLDAYLYPSNGGTMVVTHVDARRPGSGDSVAVEGCAVSLTSSEGGEDLSGSRPR